VSCRVVSCRVVLWCKLWVVVAVVAVVVFVAVVVVASCFCTKKIVPATG
jgi:hypothetical protein